VSKHSNQEQSSGAAIPERRQHERFRQEFDVRGRCLISGNASALPCEDFDARIQNLSAGGVCIMSARPLPPALFFSCNFPVVNTPVSVPTLMQVRWTARRGKAGGHVAGFQFLF